MFVANKLNILTMKKLFVLYLIQFNQGSALKFVFAENEQQVLDYAKKTFDNFKYTYKVEEVIDLTELKPTN